ncbi:hypothetical protein B7P43_G05229 [Cryptotermes secundus]|uniref:BTB domain-containing protein n=2 Tax=Cryptotermes secundus TaxID=105785 RepID=A0A2J7PLM5_9NEOP|nr:hypothetical protein B7P43_G05229 [Cryptotermes secundus]PNF17235.1 hypothetical protein B7P43_G05229 [Cryptotermes secundus]PNF17236.1 hypothetical protein B7P43_G05229 [Cryptotermes secundus]PNF17239.1 hypothetical protein B7P43_G05229 [Cryptotermes secundus]
MGSDQQFCLRWHNYQSSLLASLPQLLDGDDLTDVTLSAGGRNLRAHRVVLSACSQYFKELFKVLQPLQHPVIVLPGANFTDLCALVTFMYSGEVNIYQEQLPGLLNMADAMQIRGLAEVNGSAGKLSGNETAPSSKKEATTSSAKRVKISTNPAIGPVLSNQSPAAEMKPPQAETVDIHGHFMKAKLTEYEMYGGSGSQITKQLSNESDLHYGNLQKEGGTKKLVMSDSLDLYVENIPSKKSVRGANSKMETEDTVCQSPSILGLPLSIDNSATTGTKVKIEREPHNNEGSGHARISPDLASVLKRAAGIEDMELGSSDNSAVHAQHSPSSEDSSGGNFGPDAAATAAAANRIHLSPGLSLTGCPATPPSRQSVLCPVCGRLISQRRNLNQHMRTHQMATGEDRTLDHTELAQVSVLPLNHVQVHHAAGSRSMRSTSGHHTHPPQPTEEGSTMTSDAMESLHGTTGMLTLMHTPPRYS